MLFQNFLATVIAMLLAVSGALTHQAADFTDALGSILAPQPSLQVQRPPIWESAAAAASQTAAAAQATADTSATSATTTRHSNFLGPIAIDADHRAEHHAAGHRARRRTQTAAAFNGVSQSDLTAALNSFANNLHLEIDQEIAQQLSPPPFPQQVAAGGNGGYVGPPAAERIDNLSNTTITDPTITGGSISGTSIPASSLTGPLAITDTGTSTFANGFNISHGCFSQNGTCITGGGGSSQWLTTGSDISYAAGDVAIGTTTALHEDPWANLTLGGSTGSEIFLTQQQ